MKKIVLLVFVLVLSSTSMIGSFIRPVEASGTITIKADGSIDPPDAPINTTDMVTYYFTDNINDSIVVERDNIVLDGAGYTLQGTGSGNGIDLSYRNNITNKNMEIKAFYNQYYGHGIRLDFSSNNSIVGNNITNNWWGIYMYSSSYNSIIGNNITNNWHCIRMVGSNYNSIAGNNMANNTGGFRISYSSNNSIVGNVFTDDGLWVEDSYGNVVEDNLVNGKPLVYLEGVSDVTIENAGQVILINCDNIRVENLSLCRTTVGIQLWNTKNTKITGNNIKSNSWSGIGLFSSLCNNIVGNNMANNIEGIRLDGSRNNSIVGNNITNSYFGIWLLHSPDNIIVGNNIKSNSWSGIWLDTPNNKFYHNNFVNNTNQVTAIDSGNVWDDGYPSGGNYWSDYTGVDANMDGIGDNFYKIDSTNIDHYPLMGMFSDFPVTLEAETYHVTTVCNSTISAFEFDQVNRIIRFNVTGEEGIGFCRVCIPHDLMEPPYTVTVDGNPPLYVNYTLYDNGTHRWIYFTYQHSTHEVIIIPEFPTWTSMLLILILLTVPIIIYKRRPLKTPIN